MDLLEVTGLTKRYGGVVALSGADFSARQGEVHALLGENGAGKSTLIQILAGAVRHDGGTIRVNGKLYTPANPDAALDSGIAAVFQELSLIPDLTVEQNILAILETCRLSRTERAVRLKYLLEELDLTRLAKSKAPFRQALCNRNRVEPAQRGLTARQQACH